MIRLYMVYTKQYRETMMVTCRMCFRIATKREEKKIPRHVHDFNQFASFMYFVLIIGCGHVIHKTHKANMCVADGYACKYFHRVIDGFCAFVFIFTSFNHSHSILKFFFRRNFVLTQNQKYFCGFLASKNVVINSCVWFILSVVIFVILWRHGQCRIKLEYNTHSRSNQRRNDTSDENKTENKSFSLSPQIVDK